MPPKLKPGDTVEGHTYFGGDPNAQSSWVNMDDLARSGKTGDEFLGLISQQHPSLVPTLKALSEGRQAVPTNKSTTDPYWQSMMGLARLYDPSLDQVDYGTRFSTSKSFRGDGTSAQNIRNLNQGLGHLHEMVQAIPRVAGHAGFLGLGNTLNKLQNNYEEGNGDPGITAYNVPRTALSSELAAIFKGKGASSEKEIEKFYQMLDINSSSSQKKEAAVALTKLLNSRLDELAQQYTQGMGTSKQGIEFLNPVARKQFNDIQALSGETPSAAGEVGVPEDEHTTALLKKYGAKKQ